MKNNQKTICYRCENEITSSNTSLEHIILNACGGRLKSTKLLCKKCNSEFGKNFDAELAKSTNDIANLLLIKRDKGEPQPIRSLRESTRDDYYLNYGGSPSLAKAKFEFFRNDNGETMLHIQANNSKEAIKMIKGLKRKYPNLNDGNLLASMKEEEVYIDDTFTIKSHIGGDEVFKSITKTSINFFLLNGGDRKYIRHLLPYLENKEKADIAWMHYPDKHIYVPQNDEVKHVLKIVGDKDQRILYCYVELFNLHCFIVRLNENYEGESIDIDYIFDVHSYAVETNKTFLKLSKHELSALFENKSNGFIENVKKRYARIVSILYKKQDEREKDKILKEALDATLGRLKEGDIIDEKTLNEFVDIVSLKFATFLVHRDKRYKK